MNPNARRATSIFASASNIPLDNRKAVKNVLAKRQDWQYQAIDDIRAIGELAYGLTIPSSLVSRSILFAAKMPDETDGEPVRLEDSDPAAKFVNDTIERLGNSLARTDLQFDLAFNLLATGECYLICFAERPADPLTGDIGSPEHWEIRAISEVNRDGRTVKVYNQENDTVVTLDHTKGDTFIRIWRPDPFQHDKAWANTRSILTPAEELLWWDAAAQAAAKNRLVLAGLVGFPDDLSVKAEQGDPPGLQGSALFIKRFIDTAIQAIRNPNDASAAVPMAFTYPRNDRGVSGVDKIEWERPQDELLEKRTERSLQRMEQGLNLPVGIISGLGQSTHWGGGQVEESVFRDHVEPTIILICAALTRAFLRPILLEAGIPDPEKYFVWYDASNLIIHQDRAANALRSVELGLIAPRAARRELGFSENDTPTEEEREDMLDWMQRVRGANPDKEAMVEEGENPVPTDPNAPPVPPTGPGKDAPKTPKVNNPSQRGKGQNPAIAASIFAAQVQTLCDEQVRRALERAGNKLRNRANRDSSLKDVINGAKPTQVAPLLGRSTVATLGVSDLWDDAFTELNSRVIGILPAEFLAMDTIGPINGLIHELRVVCAERLFSPPAPDEKIVPMSLVNQTIQLCTQPGTLSIDPNAA